MRVARAAVAAVALVCAAGRGNGAPGAEAGQVPTPAPRRTLAKPVVTPPDETLTKIIRLRSKLRDLDLTWEPGSRMMVLTGFTAILGGGPISAEGRVNWFNPSGEHHMKLTLKDVDFRTALMALNFQLDGRIDTRISGTLDFRWRGLKLRQMKQTASGQVHLTLSGGTATRMQMLDLLAQRSGIASLVTIAITRAEMVAECRDGVLTASRLYFEMPDGRIEGTAVCVVETEALDAKFQLHGNRALAGQSSLAAVREAALRGKPDRAGFVALPVRAHYGGDLVNPLLYPEAP